MRFQLMIISGALGLASFLALAMGADDAGGVADYAALGLVPVFYLARSYMNNRRGGDY